MKRFKKRKIVKISKVIYIVLTLIFFFTIFLFYMYNKLVNSKLIEASFIKLNEFMDSFLSNNINYDLLKDNVIKDIIVINKNDSGEILYVSYNIEKAYYALDVVTKELEDRVSELERGKLDVNDENVYMGKKGIALKVPLLISTSSMLLSNLGPSIYVPVNFVGSLITNIKTKITDYGINNALVEIYITIELKTNLLTPITVKNEKINYDVLIASTVVNGRVPNVYGGLIESKSNSLSVPIE